MLLADFAQVSDGKLTVVGGGWSLTGPEPAPFGIAILIRVPWDQANQRHVMRLELLDADGIAVEVDAESGDGEEPIVFFDDVPFEVGRPAGLKPGTPLDFPVAINSGPLMLAPGTLRVAADDRRQGRRRLAAAVLRPLRTRTTSSRSLAARRPRSRRPRAAVLRAWPTAQPLRFRSPRSSARDSWSG